jgi:hypothetical protein
MLKVAFLLRRLADFCATIFSTVYFIRRDPTFGIR